MAILKKQPTAKPTRKITAGIGIGGPLAVIVIALLNAAGVEVGAELSGAIGALMVFAVSYLTREKV